MKKRKHTIYRTGGSFDLEKTIRFKRKLYNKPITRFIYNKTKSRRVKNNADWLDGLNFGFDECLRSLENWLKPTV